jgi:hypothetical protein
VAAVALAPPLQEERIMNMHKRIKRAWRRSGAAVSLRTWAVGVLLAGNPTGAEDVGAADVGLWLLHKSEGGR